MNVLTYVTIQVWLKDTEWVSCSHEHIAHKMEHSAMHWTLIVTASACSKWLISKVVRVVVIIAWSTVMRCIAYSAAMNNRRHISEVELIKHVSILALSMEG